MHKQRGVVEAKLLGITIEEFTARVNKGENPREMLTKAGVTEEAVRNAMQQATKDKLAQDVASGTITQAQANERIAHMAKRDTQRDALEKALTNKDFTAFQAAVAGTNLEGKITSTSFPRLIEAHSLMKQARTIMDELGVHGIGMDDMGARGVYR